MAKPRPGSFWQRRLSAFADAWRGIGFLLRDEAHARFHLLATILVICLGWWVELTKGEWLALILVIGMVWVAESLNSAIEACVDLACPEQHPLAGKAKDLAAGAVLLASICACVVGIFLFLPP